MIVNEIKLTLPLPPSVNLLFSGRERRFKSLKYKMWLEDAEASQIGNKRHIIHGDRWLEVSYKFYTPIYNKGNGKKKVWDVFNFEKALSDFLGTLIEGFDDHKILRGTVEKVHSPRREVEILIKEIISPRV